MTNKGCSEMGSLFRFQLFNFSKVLNFGKVCCWKSLRKRENNLENLFNLVEIVVQDEIN